MRCFPHQSFRSVSAEGVALRHRALQAVLRAGSHVIRRECAAHKRRAQRDGERDAGGGEHRERDLGRARQ